MNCKRSARNIEKVINDFLRKRNIFQDNVNWKLGESPLGGIGVFASRDIECGEEVFKDSPIIIGPRSTNKSTYCVVCFEQANLKPCTHNCGLPICSKKCENAHGKECELIRSKRQDNPNLDIELFKNLTPLRSLLILPEDKLLLAHLKSHKGSDHGFEVDNLKKVGLNFEELEEEYLRFVCCVLDTNSFEVLVGKEENQSNTRGLFPLASLVNHSCVPNVMHVFDENQLMIVRASCDIKKNQELFHSYARLFWSTPSRHYNLLRTKHFVCRCPRCSDPTEFGTYMSAFLCKICKGNVISKNPLSLKSNWCCEDCHTVVSSLEIGKLLTTLGAILRSFSAENFDVMLRFFKGKVGELVPSNNEIVVELKYKMVWIIGYHENFKWKDVDTDLLELKKKLCQELLNLVEKLGLGNCKLKGLLLYQLHLCLQEIHRRSKSTAINGFAKNGNYINSELLDQAVAILKYDIDAPKFFE